MHKKSFRVIRVNSNCGVIILASPENASPNTADAEFFIHNQHTAKNNDPFFLPGTTNAVLGYFSGIADGLDWINPPAKIFNSLKEIERWSVRAAERYYEKAELQLYTAHFALVGNTGYTRRKAYAYLKTVYKRSEALLVFKRVVESTQSDARAGIRALNHFAKSLAVLKDKGLNKRISLKIKALKQSLKAQ